MSARDDNPELHRIEVERDADGEVENVRFVCDGGPEAPCHHWPDCGCETWGEGNHFADDDREKPAPGHEDVAQEHCWMAPWFNDTTSSPDDFLELYDGPDVATHDAAWFVSGPVSATFEGDYMTWEYAS